MDQTHTTSHNNDAWKYYAFRFCGATIARLPKPVGYKFASFAGRLVYLLSPSTRRNITANLRHVLGPDADEAVLKKTARAAIITMSKNYFDLLKVPRMKLADIMGSIHIHGGEHLDETVRRGKGFVLATAHLGSFDIAAQALTGWHTKVSVLVENLEPPRLFNHVCKLRASQGLTLAPVRPGVARVVLQALRRGEAVVAACDRDVQDNGLPFRFFGKETTLPLGMVTLATRAGAPIIPVFTVRRPDGGYDIFFEPPIEPACGEEELAGSMARLVALMEKHIRRYPEQWIVSSPVWQERRAAAPEVKTTS